MEKVECNTCGAMILPTTSEKNDGLCAPCFKKENAPQKVLPQKSAYSSASFLLLINAIASAYFMWETGAVNQYVFSIIIDTVLAVFLLQQHEVARIATIIRSVVGLAFPLLIHMFENTPTSQLIESTVIQCSYSGALILFLGWQTVRWRFYIGWVLSVVYITYIGLFSVAINA
ncbi:MAG: hypothetical protein ISR69_13990 [Gammaproteobacteria bacterium]|nr:hypothetical protein [Gammaproteobacteria bacterium]